MKYINKKLLVLTVVFLTLFSVAGCAGVKLWPEKKGQVLEVGTNKPIEGAIVVALWTGRRNVAFVDSQSTCYHVETATTDAQGNYTIPSHFDGIMQGNVFNKGIDVHVYKAGYVVADKTYKEETYRKGIYLLQPFKGTRKERLDYLKNSALHGCGSDEESKKISPFNRAILYEAKNIAKTNIDKKIVNSIKAALDMVEVGGEETQRRIGEGWYK